MCIGANFADHFVGLGLQHADLDRARRRRCITLDEARAQALSSPPWGFYKMGSSISNPDEDVQYPSRTKLLDYEGEVALIIGKRGKDIKRADLLEHVFGYTLFDDFSLRDNMDKGVMNFARVKNFQGSGALGPIVALKDEAPRPAGHRLLDQGQRRGQAEGEHQGHDPGVRRVGRVPVGRRGA